MTARAWLLFALSSVIWGIPYLFIKIAVEAGVPPAFLAWSRSALGAAILLPMALHRGVFRGLWSRRGPIAAYTACEIAVPFVLIAVGERYISSSLTAILIATMPLFVAVLAIALSRKDKPTGVRMVGLLVGFSGVVALLGIDVGGRPHELLGAALVLVATLGYAIAPLIADRYLIDLDPLGPVTASLALASVALLPAAIAHPLDAAPTLAAVGAIGVLGVVCTAIGLVVFFQLIAAAGPARASVITYVNPVIAVIVGVLVLDERLGAVAIGGMLLILLGSWLSARH